jgi:uncharacterized protein YndB with AHSA1/START domain
MLQFELEGTFTGNVSDIYAAWHEPKRLINWFGLNDLVVGQIMSDFRVGGKFRFQLYDITGMAHVLMGEYMDIQRDNRLHFSWQWVGEPHLSEVEVLFDDVNDQTTNLQLIHSGFDDEEDMELHHQAWVGCLDRLTLAAM